MKKIKLLLAVSAFTMMNVNLKAQSPDDVLNLLISRNVITQTDADSIRAEAAIKEQDKKANQKLFPLNLARNIQLFGYTQVRFQSLQEGGKPDGLDIRRARLDLRGNVSPDWEYRLQLEFANAPKALDAYAVYKIKDWLKFTAGQFKVPFSLENLTPSNKLEAIDRSQVVEALVARSKDVIGNQNGRDLGLQAGGSTLKLKDRFIVDYAIGVFNGTGINVTGDNNEIKDICGRLLLHPVAGLDVGGAYYSGFTKVGTSLKSQVRNRAGAELSYTLKSLTFKGEFIQGKDQAIKKGGWYAQAGYFVKAKKFQVLAKYDAYDPNTDSAKKDDSSVNYIGGVNYFFNDFAKLAVFVTNKHEEGKQVNNDIIAAQLQIGF